MSLRNHLHLHPLHLQAHQLNQGAGQPAHPFMPETTLNTLLDHRSQFLGFVNRRVSSPALAEDILQSAYMRALQSNAAPDAEESIVAWFYRILRNAVIDHYRRRATENKALEALALESWAKELETTPTPETKDEVCACLTRVLDAIPPNYAELLRAVDLNEQPLHDFARQHSLTATNAGVRAHRARAALRKQLIKTCGACAEHACVDCTCRAS